MSAKILYVEDEPFLAQIVQESLQSRLFDVKLVQNGRDAVAVFKKFNPQICILDIMLPGKSGYDIAKEIRFAEPKIPIIFLTAKNQTEDVVKGFESGGNDYLRKPFSMEELIVRINNLLMLSVHTQSNALTLGKYTLGHFNFNPSMYELCSKGKAKKLSYKENSLLLMLCENKGFPVERKKILMKLWGDDSFYNSRNLDVYINKLREYLKPDPDVEIITIKGVGYHLVMKKG